jgi:uncharacterized protein YebE (UPF0316 family)
MLLPVLIFVAEMCVVTLGTLRIIFVSRGMKGLASGLGFFEISIWLFAIGQIMQNLNSLSCFAAFAGGFTTGNFCGILIEKRLAIGTQVVRTITKRDAIGLIDGLRKAGYGVTCLEGQGATGPVHIVFTVIKRKQLPDVVAIIKRFDPKAFYSIDDVQEAAEGVFPVTGRRPGELPLGLLPRIRRAA